MLESAGSGLLRTVLESPDDDAPRSSLPTGWTTAVYPTGRGSSARWSRPRRTPSPGSGTPAPVKPSRAVRPDSRHPPSADGLDRRRLADHPPRPNGEYRRGFVESVSLPAWAFAITAPALFLTHPVTHVEFPDRGTIPQMEERSRGAVVAHAMALPYHWPAELFPDKPIGEVLWLSSFADAKAGLSRAAVGYGRRSVGLPMVGEGSPVGATSEGYCNPGATGVGGSG